MFTSFVGEWVRDSIEEGLGVGVSTGEFDGSLVDSRMLVGIALDATVGNTDETPVGLALGAEDSPGSSVGEGVQSPSRTFHKSP